MVIRNVTVNDCTPETIVIGRRGTFETMQVVFDLTYLIENYGDGTAVLALKRSQDTSAYPAVEAQDGNTLTWVVREVDTYYVGAGECQLMWYVDGGLAKTIIYPMVVMRDILSTSEEAPDAYQEWVDDLTALGAETLQNAQDAAQSASDAESAKDAAEDAADRAEEAVEAFTHPTASAETLAPDAPATASYNDGHFTFGIPKGDKGDKLTYSDLTEADKLDLIQGPIADAQTAAEQAVEDKGEEVLESIPQDYTNLADNVAEIDKVVDDLAALTGPNVLLSFGDFTDVEYDKGGNYVSCTWDESHTTCTYVLNITQPPFTWVAGIYNNNTELPDEIIPGNKYYVKFDRSIEPASYLSDFYLHINCYGANQSLIWAKRIRSNTEITIPEDCEGLWIRVHVATIAAPINLTGSMTLAMIDLNVPSNAELADEIDELSEDYTELSGKVDDLTGDVTDLTEVKVKDLVKRNSANVLLSFGNFKDNSSGNLGWTWDESHTTCTYSYTGQPPFIVPRIYNGSTSLPDVLTPGETYQFKFSATRGDLYLKVMYYANGTLIGNQAVYGDRAITIPDTCDGLVIEVSTPTWAFQGSITVALVNAPSNAELAESVETLTEDVETLEGDVSSLSDNKAPVIINTVSGSIASFDDGADDMPIKSLVATIDPVQDLHGYDHPWPAGGGKNLLPMTVDGIKALNNVTFTENSCVINGITFTILTDDDGNVTGISCDGTASAVTVFWIGSMQLASGDAIKVAANTSVTGEIFFRMSGPGKGTYTVQVSSGQTYTATSDIELFGNIRIGNNQTVSNKVFYPVVCKSTETDTTFEPYSNICPISGWTGLSGKRTGKNLYQMTLRSGYTVTIRGVTFTVLNDGTISATGTNDGTGSSIIAFPISIPAGNYYYTVGSIPGAVIGSLDAYIWDGTINARAKKWNGTANVDTAGEEKLYELQIVADHVYAFNLRVANGVSVDNLIFKPMITEATESSAAFEPYAGTPISVNWQGTAGTVYVGTLDVVTGALTVTDAEIASYNGETLPSTWISDRDVYATGTTPTTGAQVVYKLAEPQTYRLDPVIVTTLRGNNAVWTDVGPVTVDYPADTTIVVSDVKNAIDQLENQVVTDITVTGTIVTITAEANKRYLCGTVASIDVTPCVSGAFDLIFTSGSTAAVLTIPNTVKWQDSSFDPSALDADTTYEISVAEGTLGLVASWT